MENIIRIEPLSESTLEEAIVLVHTIFPEEAIMNPNPGTAFKVSLAPDKYPPLGSDYLQYYVAIDSTNQEVVGTTGLYHLRTDPAHIVWLGWYSVKDTHRGKGIGHRLLQTSIDVAKAQKRTVLRVYADVDSKEALRIYDNAGFQTLSIEQGDGWQKITKELSL